MMKNIKANINPFWGTFLLFLCVSFVIISGWKHNQTDQPPNVSSSPQNLRDPSPYLYEVSAPGISIISAQGLVIDFSNASNGYITAQYTGNKRVKVQITGPDQVIYTYNVPNTSELQVFPLTAGNGSYSICGFAEVMDTKYAKILSQTIDVSLSNPFLPYLMPNQYVWFTADTNAIAKGKELAQGASCDLEVIAKVYHYCINTITYDYKKAALIPSGYLPNVDDTLHSGTGICLDYAAFMTAILRTQRIPTRLEIGYAGEAYHAWISVYTTDTGWIDNAIRFDGKNWTLIDPTLAASGGNMEQFQQYIRNGSYYKWKYSH